MCMHGVVSDTEMGLKCFALVLTASLVISQARAERVTITDGRGLRDCLCLSNGTIPHNTSLVISVKSLNLPPTGVDFCRVENTTNITIKALDELVNEKSSYMYYVSVKCEGHTGFGFFNVTNIQIRSVYFENCDNIVPASVLRYLNESGQFFSYFSGDISTSLFFNHCHNLTLYNVLANSYASVTASVMGVNLCGHSNISAEVNDITPNTNMLIFFIDSPIMTNLLECDFHVSSNALISDFLYGPVNSELKPHLLNFIFQESALGVCLAQEEFIVNADIHVSSRKIRQTFQKWMMSVFIVIASSSLLSKVTFQGYPNNMCTPAYQEELMPVLLSIHYYSTATVANATPSVLVTNTAFPCDWAQTIWNGFVGGLSIISSDSYSHQVNITNVSICAYAPQPQPYAYTSLFSALKFNPKGHLKVEINNILIRDYYGFEYYSDNGLNDTMMLLIGANVSLEGTNVFNSSGAPTVAILAQTANLTISGDFTIIDKCSYASRGIVLRYSSTLFLKEPLNATFYNQRASQGSAISAKVACSGDQDGTEINSIQIVPTANYLLGNLSSINIALYFKNSSNDNTNGEGTQLYAPQLNFLWDQYSFNTFNCTTWDTVNSQYACTTLIDTIIKEMNDYDKYTSLANGICFKEHGQLPWKCHYIDSMYYAEVSAYPGEVAFSIPAFKSSDEQVRADAGLEKFSLHTVQTIKNQETLYTGYACPSNGFQPYDTVSLSIVLTLTNPLYNFRMDLTVLQLFIPFNCPVGFELKIGYAYECYCVCLSVLHEHGYNCNISTRQISAPSKHYWTGLISNPEATIYTLSISKTCPPRFCNTNLGPFHLDHESLADLSCLGNRTGVLCGQCRVNHSAVFGSDECKPCSNLYLLTLPVYALAGVLLVTLLFALRLTVATGTILGPVFYANTLGLVLGTLTEGHHGTFLTIARIFISLLNLELGFPLCLYNGMTPSMAVGLQFVFPVYLWSIVVGIIFLSRYSVRLSNLISESSVQVLATLFYLSFSSLLHVAIVVVTSGSVELNIIDSASDKKITQSEHRLVWFYSGQIAYGHGIHGFYLGIACLFVAFYILPFTLFTTFSHHLLRFGVVNRLRPFIDAFAGPFKDKWRVWFGLRLWVMVLLSCVSSALLGTHFPTLLSIHLGVVGAYLVLQAYVQPFKNLLIGLFDTLYMALYLLLLESYFVFSDKLVEASTVLQSAFFLALFLALCHHFWHTRLLESLKVRVVGRVRGYETLGGEQVSQDDEQERLLWEAARDRDGRK